MDLTRALELIDRQIQDANQGVPKDFDGWLNRTEIVIRSIFGDESPMHRKLEGVRYSPMMWTESTDFAPYRRLGVQETISLLEASKLEIELQYADKLPNEDKRSEPAPARRIFIVHGQNDARKYELEAFLQKLVSEPPTILHQQPNAGRVLIEKFEQSAASVGYAVVLLTGDDVGRSLSLDVADERPRARQNVVFELGFFIGLIGRARVTVLYEPGVELPSDISGLVYVPLDNAGAWKGKLASEIDHSGIEVNWAALGSS